MRRRKVMAISPWAAWAALVGSLGAFGPALGATYWVDGANPQASDAGPGTEAQPWRTLARAGRAPELQPGDTVLVRSGVYRECLDILVSGEPSKPVTFSAAPGARVVIKGSEPVDGTKWQRLAQQPGIVEPFPNAFRGVWKIILGEEFFRDPYYPDAYAEVSRRHLSQVADNVEGFRVADRNGWQILRNVILMNNLILANSLPGDTQGIAGDLLFWMHNDGEDRRADTSNHSDYNAFAANPTPILKPGYGHGNTRPLDQWRERFGEDIHSRVLPISFHSSHAGFRLLATEGLDFAAPLPQEVTRVWQPRVPGQVVAGVASWPER